MRASTAARPYSETAAIHENDESRADARRAALNEHIAQLGVGADKKVAKVVETIAEGLLGAVDRRSLSAEHLWRACDESGVPRDLATLALQKMALDGHADWDGDCFQLTQLGYGFALEVQERNWPNRR